MQRSPALYTDAVLVLTTVLNALIDYRVERPSMAMDRCLAAARAA